MDKFSYITYIGDEHVRTSGEGNEPDTFGTDTVYVWLWLQVVRQNTAHKSTQITIETKHVDWFFLGRPLRRSGITQMFNCPWSKYCDLIYINVRFFEVAAIFRYDSRRFPWRLMCNAAGFSSIVFMRFGLHMFLANLHWTFSLVLLLAPHLCNLLHNGTYL